MHLTWLIEAGVYGAEIGPLLAEIARQGMVAATIPHRLLAKGMMPVVRGQALGAESRVIGYGTFPFARQIQLHSPWRPGAWCDPTRLDCAVYFPFWKGHLLNGDCEILPVAEAMVRREELIGRRGRGGRVFVRPAGAAKLFTGRTADVLSFVGAVGSARFDAEARVVVSAARPIGREWRLVVAGDRVVAASRYAVGGRRDIAAGCPDEVMAYAGAVLAAVAWRPDPIFLLDVGESEGRLWVVELNGFSCSWIYACDPRAVVVAVGALA